MTPQDPKLYYAVHYQDQFLYLKTSCLYGQILIYSHHFCLGIFDNLRQTSRENKPFANLSYTHNALFSVVQRVIHIYAHILTQYKDAYSGWPTCKTRHATI